MLGALTLVDELMPSLATVAFVEVSGQKRIRGMINKQKLRRRLLPNAIRFSSTTKTSEPQSRPRRSVGLPVSKEKKRSSERPEVSGRDGPYTRFAFVAAVASSGICTPARFLHFVFATFSRHSSTPSSTPSSPWAFFDSSQRSLTKAAIQS